MAKIDDDIPRQEYLIQRTQQGVNLVHITKEFPLSILAHILVKNNLEVSVFQNQQLVPASCYAHIMTSIKVTLLSEILNLVAFAKIFHTGKLMSKETLKFKFAALIDDHLAISDDDQEIRSLKFLLEQVELMMQNKHSRRYSTSLLMTSYIIHSTSARAYERLLEEQVLMLPSVKTFKKLTMNLDQRTGISDFKYLKLRYSQLNSFDRNVLLMIDEICPSKQVEASGGQVFGLTDSCEVATTALCFMIKSFSSGYKDMVGIYPIKDLKAETQNQGRWLISG